MHNKTTTFLNKAVSYYVLKIILFIKSLLLYDALGRDELKRFFYTNFVGIVETIIDKSEEETHKKIPDNFKKFLASFYTEAIAGILVERMTYQDQQSKEELVTYISAVLRSSLTSVVREFPNTLDSLNNKSDA